MKGNKNKWDGKGMNTGNDYNKRDGKDYDTSNRRMDLSNVKSSLADYINSAPVRKKKKAIEDNLGGLMLNAIKRGKEEASSKDIKRRMSVNL